MVALDDPRIREAYAEPEELPRMAFGDHLDELRKRLLRAACALVVAVLAMLPFHDEVQGIITEPYRILWRQAFTDHVAMLVERERVGTLDTDFGSEFLANCRKYQDQILAGTFPWPNLLPTKTGFNVPYTLVSVSPLEDFWVFMMASFVFAFVIASPVVLWQLWAFVAAGLYAKERKVFYRYFPFATVLMTTGVVFGYLCAVPVGMGWLVRMMRFDQVQAMLGVGQYFTLLFAMTAALGAIFQLPLVMVALQRIGIVRHKTLSSNWRAIVLAIFVLSAVITPPDPFSMLLMAGPTLLLYMLGLLLTWRGRSTEAPAP